MTFDNQVNPYLNPVLIFMIIHDDYPQNFGVKYLSESQGLFQNKKVSLEDYFFIIEI